MYLKPIHGGIGRLRLEERERERCQAAWREMLMSSQLGRTYHLTIISVNSECHLSHPLEILRPPHLKFSKSQERHISDFPFHTWHSLSAGPLHMSPISSLCWLFGPQVWYKGDQMLLALLSDHITQAWPGHGKVTSSPRHRLLMWKQDGKSSPFLHVCYLVLLQPLSCDWRSLRNCCFDKLLVVKEGHIELRVEHEWH